LEQREATEATVFTGGSVKVITRINDEVYRIQRHPTAKMIVIPLYRLACTWKLLGTSSHKEGGM
jgi:hypothetical protein